MATLFLPRFSLAQVPTAELPGQTPATNTAPAAQVAPAAPVGTQPSQNMTVVGPATNTSQPASQPGADAGKAASPWAAFQPMFLMILMIVVLYMVVLRGPRKEKKQRELLLNQMKKGDRVVTAGGLVARVVSIDGDDVVLKIDESANVKATYKKSSIATVIPAGGEEKAK